MINNPVINSRVGSFPIGNSAGALQLLIQNLLNVVIGLVGLFLLVMLIRGGYQYITAGGDKEAVQKATKTITTALIGAVILLSLFAIIRVVEGLFGLNLLAPVIPTI